MGDVVRLIPKVRNEDVQRSEFSSHTGTIYKFCVEAENNDGTYMNIYVCPDTVTTANFSALKDGDILIDKSAAPIKIYLKEGDTDADSFTTVTTTS